MACGIDISFAVTGTLYAWLVVGRDHHVGLVAAIPSQELSYFILVPGSASPPPPAVKQKQLNISSRRLHY